MPRKMCPARQAAKDAGAVRFFNGIPCPRGHVGDRFTSSGTCAQCLLDRKQTPERKARDAARAARAEGAEERRAASIWPASRAAARQIGAKRYFSGVACGRGHVAERLTSSNGCFACLAEMRASFTPERKKYQAEAARASYHKDVDASRAKNKARRAADLEKHRAYGRLVYARAGDKIRASWREYYRRTKDKHTLRAAQRQAWVRQATPKWADMKAIAAVYDQRIEMSAASGIPHHVDHIVPVRGKNVCGLHVHWNLRVIPGKENLSKSGKLVPELGIDLTAPGWAHLHPQAA